jgi:hypothetical protein
LSELRVDIDAALRRIKREKNCAQLTPRPRHSLAVASDIAGTGCVRRCCWVVGCYITLAADRDEFDTIEQLVKAGAFVFSERVARCAR